MNLCYLGDLWRYRQTIGMQLPNVHSRMTMHGGMLLDIVHPAACLLQCLELGLARFPIRVQLHHLRPIFELNV